MISMLESEGRQMDWYKMMNNQVPFDKNGSFSQGFRNTGDANRGDGSVSNVVGGSEYQSEDVEDESLDVKKPTTGQSTSAKRSWAAEVHNLSEREKRWVDEKMCALQELIPNCNKVDKASMRDEAIEHPKTLQLQVQG